MHQREGSPRSDALGSPARALRRGGERTPRCYGIQVLIAGRRKGWRDRVSAQVRQAGYAATTVDCAVDALTVLVLGLPIDVLVSDIDGLNELDGTHLAVEARALRPNLGIVYVGEGAGNAVPEVLPDVLTIPAEARDASAAVREALARRA